MAEQIRVARHEDDQIELLGLERNPDRAFRRVQAEGQDDDRDDVRHLCVTRRRVDLADTIDFYAAQYIATETKEIHVSDGVARRVKLPEKLQKAQAVGFLPNARRVEVEIVRMLPAVTPGEPARLPKRERKKMLQKLT